MQVTRRAWLVWGVAVLGYALAVFHRSSLAVAGLDAQHRYGVDAAMLSLFAVLQLLVYAAMQIPVGVLLDRYGSRRLLVTGGVVMALGQAFMAFSTTVAQALVARALVGAGDAMMFISVLKLIGAWFPSRRVPLISQLTGMLGHLGQVVATYPLLLVLRAQGWQTSFAIVAGVGLAVALLTSTTVRDVPGGTAQPHRRSRREMAGLLGEAWQEPGTRLGLWTHLVTSFPVMTFGLLWGYPFLVQGQQRSPEVAGVLLTVLGAGSLLAGPVIGWLIGRSPAHRWMLVVGIVGGTVGAWSLVLAWPGRAPLPLLVVLVLALATNGPASMIGQDYGRTFNPPHRVGSASGVINIGGYVAAVLTILAIGVLLQHGPGDGTGDDDLAAFRVAFLAPYPVWAIGLIGFAREHRLSHRRGAVVGATPEPAALPT